MDANSDEAKQRAREAQARFRIKQKAHLDSLMAAVDSAQQRLNEYLRIKAQHKDRKLQLMQRGMQAASELASVCRHSHTSLASQATPASRPPCAQAAQLDERFMPTDTRVRVASKTRNIYTIVPNKPRSIDTYNFFESISYSDLLMLSRQGRPSSGEERAASNGSGGDNIDIDAEHSGESQNGAYTLPQGSGSMFPAPSTVNTPVDTSKVSVMSLVRDHLIRQANVHQVPESEICWWVETNFPISRSHDLAFSTQLGSRECAASSILGMMLATFEFMLFTLTVEELEGALEIQALDAATAGHRSVEDVRQELMHMSECCSDSESSGKSHSAHASWPRLPLKRSGQETASFVRSKNVLVPTQPACMYAVTSMVSRYIGVLPSEKLEAALTTLTEYIVKCYAGLSAATAEGGNRCSEDHEASEPVSQNPGGSTTTNQYADSRMPAPQAFCPMTGISQHAQSMQHTPDAHTDSSWAFCTSEGLNAGLSVQAELDRVEGSLEASFSHGNRVMISGTPSCATAAVESPASSWSTGAPLSSFHTSATPMLLDHICRANLDGLNGLSRALGVPEIQPHSPQSLNLDNLDDLWAERDTDEHMPTGPEISDASKPSAKTEEAIPLNEYDSYLKDVMRNFLELFASIGDALTAVSYKLKKMGKMPLEKKLRSKEGLVELERIATSSTLDCLLLLLMGHCHSKPTIKFLTVDMVSPCVTHAQVENLHMRLYKYLSPDDIQRSNMAEVWFDWERRKRGLDVANAHAIATLNSLLSSARTDLFQLLPLDSHISLPDLAARLAAAADAAGGVMGAAAGSPLGVHTPYGMQYVVPGVEDQFALADMTFMSGALGAGENRSIAPRNVQFASAGNRVLWKLGAEEPMRVCPHCGLSKDVLVSGGARKCECVLKHFWPGLIGQCPVSTSEASIALCELKDVGYSDSRLYEAFLEVRLHPSTFMSSRQIMKVIAESLKQSSIPTDIMALFQIAAAHQQHCRVFSDVAHMTL